MTLRKRAIGLLVILAAAAVVGAVIGIDALQDERDRRNRLDAGHAVPPSWWFACLGNSIGSVR